MDGTPLLRRLPPAVALRLLEAGWAPGQQPSGVVLALELAPDDATFERWCARLSLASPAPCPALASLVARLPPARALAVAEADRDRGAVGLAAAEVALQRAALRSARAEDAQASAALADALARDPLVASRVALERLALGEPIAALPAARDPRDAWLVARERLRRTRREGLYTRVAALDALVELADAAKAPIARACLRTALEHLDALGSAASALELDRVRTLRDRVAPGLLAGPPLDPEVDTLGPRARAALEGKVRGPLPPPDEPGHPEALALEVLAHLVAVRPADFRALAALPQLPAACWVILGQARGDRLRRASATLAARVARELAPPAEPILPLALAYRGEARRALLVAALARGEAAEGALRSEIEADALALRDRGDRPAAIALLEELERALAGDGRAARALAQR